MSLSALQRAEEYAAVFIKVGERWPGFVPVDACRVGDELYIQGVKMEPLADGSWRLTENGERWVVRRAPVKEKAS